MPRTGRPKKFSEAYKAVLSHYTTRQSAVDLAERIPRIVAELRIAQLDACPATISIGLAVAHEHPPGSDLVSIADHAIYATKRGERNKAVVADNEPQTPATDASPEMVRQIEPAPINQSFPEPRLIGRQP